MLEQQTNSNKYEGLVVYYFSGTGNARNCAMWMQEYVGRYGIKAETFYLADREKLRFPESSEKKILVGFIYPTHGFNAPPVVLKFLWSFPRIKNADVFLMNTRGGMKLWKMFTPGLSGLALLLPSLFLLLKGYGIRALKPVDLPSNWISLHPGLRNRVVDSIYSHWKGNVISFTEKLFSGKVIYRGLIDLPLDILITPVSIGYYFFGRYMLAKTFIATNECNQCKLCIESCPVNAIGMRNNAPYWKFTCESCMRCMNSCPERAIQTSQSISIGLWYTASIAVGFLIGETLVNYGYFTYQDFILKDVISPLAKLIVTFIFVFFAYRVIHFGMKYRWVNALVRYTSFTSYKFWRRYKSGKR